MKSIRFWLAALLVTLIALFALQNMAIVEVQFLFWSFQTRRFLVLAITLVIGAALGWLIKSHMPFARRRNAGQATPDG